MSNNLSIKIIPLPPESYGLKDRGERCDPDPGAHQHGVLCPVDVAGWRTKRTVNHDLKSVSIRYNLIGENLMI